MNFTDEDEERLIKLVSENPVIYDAKHEDYRDTVRKENAWKIIAEELQKNSEDCKKKWKFIRDGYQRFRKKNKLGPGCIPPKNSKDKRHQQLTFLDYFPRNKPKAPPSGASTCHSGSLSPEQIMETKCIEAFNNEDDTQTSADDLDIENNYAYLMENVSKQRENHDTNIENNNKRIIKYWKQRDDKRLQLLKTISKKKEDDVELFCRHIAEVLRNLPPLLKAEAKKDIGIMVSNFEIKAAEMLVTSIPNLLSQSSILPDDDISAKADVDVKNVRETRISNVNKK